MPSPLIKKISPYLPSQITQTVFSRFNKRLNITLSLIFFISSTHAIAALPSGDEIAKNINARDEGISVSRNLKMTMTDKHGKTRTRNTKAFRKYYGEDKRTVIFYLQPKNVKNTAFLTWDYADTGKDDDQWLYLPAMRKIRRISASDRGDYFLGTDFSYEDIKLESRVSIKDYDRQTIGESEVDNHHCYLVTAIPSNQKIAKELGYSKVEQCVDSKIWIVRKATFWGLKGKLLKTAHFREIKRVQGIWTQHRLEIENHKTQHKTVFIFSNVDYKKPLKDSLFQQNAIQRGL